ncbi:MAG: TolC family protein [Terracidiphilus sp.]|jgi:outer membrane protein TolC
MGNTSRAQWLPILLGAAVAAAPALVSAQVSLATVVDLAQRNSTSVRMNEADVRKAQAALSQTVDAYIPTVSIGSTVGPPSIGFPAGQPSIANASMQSVVLSFSQRQYIHAARSGVEAATLALKDAREQVALDASAAYIELDTVNRELDAAQRQESFAGRLVEIEQQRTEAGVDPLSELLQARLTAAQIRLNRLHLETRAATLAKQLANLTGLPTGSITPDHGSIPEIPAVSGDQPLSSTSGIKSAQLLARSKQMQARGDGFIGNRPQVFFGAQYNRDSTALNNYNEYYTHFKADNFSVGFQIEVPLFDLGHRAKARESAADALRATVEAEQAQRQNEVQIAELTGSLRELDALAEIASLKQQITGEQLKSVLAQLELGNGSGVGPNATPQLSPKAEQLARIDESQKVEDALEAGFSLAKTRLRLLRALGHMEDWLHELHAK